MDIGMIWGLLSRLRQFRARDHWTRDRLEAHQTQSLRLMRAYAYTYSPFYQCFHKGHYDAQLQELPVLTKAIMMEHFDELVTDRAIQLKAIRAHMANLKGDERFLGRYWVNATSGSSGHPGVFLFNRAEWLTVLASFARAREWADLPVDLAHRVKTATIASTTPFHISARMNATVRSWWMPELCLAASEPLESIVEQLNAWQPEILIVYAAMVRILADEQLAGHLQITLHAVFPSSEVLTEETYQRMVRAGGGQVFNQYAATESGSLAVECDQHEGMHLAEDLVIFEMVDSDNHPVPPGAYGDKLLITVLGSRTQPLIRYELSDSVRLTSSACSCRRPFRLINDIQGHMEDVLSFPGVAEKVVNVHSLIFSNIMDTLPVSGWQVVQEVDGLHVLLNDVRGELHDEMLIQTLQQTLVKQGITIPCVKVQHVASLPKTAAGKTPLIKSHVPLVVASPSDRQVSERRENMG